MTAQSTEAGSGRFSPVLLAIMANRMDAVCREMTNTMLLAARSSVIGMARDFSCAVITAEDEVLAVAEGFPIHVWGMNLQTRSMRDLHPELAEGDAYLHNDPYLGNTHPADHTLIVPVFYLLFDDAADAVKRGLARLTGGSRRPAVGGVS